MRGKGSSRMLQIRFCGVGDGDCIVVELPDGRRALIDSCIPAGGTESPALKHLRGHRLAFCCMTHPHGDHFEGMLGVLNDPAVKTESFWYALSDLDRTLEALGWTSSKPPAAPAGRAAREARQLFDLFSWVADQPVGFSRSIGEAPHYADFGQGVEVVAFGPRASDWDRYRYALAEQRRTGRPLNRERANAISITLLLRYAGQMVWLLADLTAPSLKQLPGRAAASGIGIVQPGVRAVVMKASHHAAKNGWYQHIATDLMRCQPADILVISAAGGAHHPNAAVRAYWGGTGKRIEETFIGPSLPVAPLAAGPVGAVAATVARSPGTRTPRDVIVSISPAGISNVTYDP